MGEKTATGNWTRATPRRQKGETTATVVFRPFGVREQSVRLPNAQRAKQRHLARQQSAMMHDMISGIGRNPVYAVGAPRGGEADKQYRANAKRWIDANMKRYVEA